MKTFKIEDPNNFISQEIIDINNNIFARFYQIKDKIGFRVIKYQSKQEIFDPIFESNLLWIHGIFNTISEAELAARDQYRQNQK